MATAYARFALLSYSAASLLGACAPATPAQDAKAPARESSAIAPAPSQPRASDPPPTAPSNDTSATPFARALSRAHALARAADEEAPLPKGKTHTKDESLAFVNGPMKEWLERVMPHARDADAAFREAIAAATTDDERAEAFLDVGDVWAHLAMRFYQTGTAAEPTEWRADADKGMDTMYRGALLDKARPLVARALEAYDACVAKESSRMTWCRANQAALEPLRAR